LAGCGIKSNPVIISDKQEKNQTINETIDVSSDKNK
jgi:hypothetical protein